MPDDVFGYVSPSANDRVPKAFQYIAEMIFGMENVPDCSTSKEFFKFTDLNIGEELIRNIEEKMLIQTGYGFYIPGKVLLFSFPSKKGSILYIPSVFMKVKAPDLTHKIIPMVHHRTIELWELFPANELRISEEFFEFLTT